MDENPFEQKLACVVASLGLGPELCTLANRCDRLPIIVSQDFEKTIHVRHFRRLRITLVHKGAEYVAAHQTLPRPLARGRLIEQINRPYTSSDGSGHA